MRRKAVEDDKATGLQKLMQSRALDSFLMAVIILNCITMAISDPKKADDQQDAWIIGINWFFDVIYCSEVILKIVAFGAMRYLMDPWHYIDVVVSSVSAIDIIVVIASVVSQFFGGPVVTFSSSDSSNLKLLIVS